MIDLQSLSDGTLRWGIEQVIRGRGKPTRGIDPQVWLEQLRHATRGWTDAQFRAAITSACATDPWYPTTPVICKHRPPQLSTQQGDAPRGRSGHACHRCGCESYLGGYQCADGRLLERYRCDCPNSAPGWNTPDAVARTSELRGSRD